MYSAIKKLENGSCIVAIETIYAVTKYRLPDIFRIFMKGGEMHKERGIFILKKFNKRAALVIVTNPGDLIQVIEHCLKPNERESRYFQVDANYDVLPVVKKSKFLSDAEILEILPTSVIDCWNPVEFELKRIIFASVWPSWFGEIIQCHLRLIKRKHRIYWWHVAGDAVDDRELKLIVRLRPFCALELFRDRLNKKQIQNCIKSCPDGGVRFAFDLMDEDQIHLAARSNAAYLLWNHANTLSERNFQDCLAFDPDFALEIRNKLSERRHAMVMVFALKNGMLENFGRVEKEIIAEIFISLIREYEIWNNAYGGNLNDISHDITGHGIFSFYDSYGPILNRLLNMPFPSANKTDFDLPPINYYDLIDRHALQIIYGIKDWKKKRVIKK